MNAFLAPLAVVLLLRFAFALKNRPLSGRGALGKTVLESLGLLVAFQPDPALAGVLVTLAALNALSVWLPRHLRPEVVQLGTLAGTLATLWLAAELLALHAPWEGAFFTAPLLTLVGFLVSTSEANLLIRLVLTHLDLKPRTPADTPPSAETEFNRGRVIGLLERGLIFFLVLAQQFNAIGFILAAKGIVRFKETENRDFAEYVLIGTLLSTFLALVLSWGFSAALAATFVTAP